MIQVVILTGSCRPENLPILLESILREFGRTEEERQKNGFNICWIIANDKFNSKTDISEFYEKVLFKTDLSWFGFSVGKEGQNNYGGDLFNEPLKWFYDTVCKTYDINPYVYILDDDNIIHPRLPHFIKALSDRPEYDGIVLCSSHANGEVIQPEPSILFLLDIDMRTITNPDPSHIVVKLSNYMENFPILGGLDYDFTYIRTLMFKLQSEGKLLFQQDVDPNSWFVPSSFHNGIARRYEINEFSESLDEFNITVDMGWKYGTRRFVIPKEKNKEIMDILKSLDYPVSN